MRRLALTAAALVGAATVAAGVVVVRFLWLTRPDCLNACPCCGSPLAEDDETGLFSFADLDELDTERLGLT